jgi:hypothetical protein
MSNLPTLDTPNVHAYFDLEQRISFITYKGTLDSTATNQLYDWVKELLTMIGPDATHGVIFDFRDVVNFVQGNLVTAQRQSKAINQTSDQSNHPVALIVATLHQEQMVRVSMRVSPLEHRKRVVHSLDEALAYIEEWHREHQKESNS